MISVHVTSVPTLTPRIILADRPDSDSKSFKVLCNYIKRRRASGAFGIVDFLGGILLG